MAEAKREIEHQEYNLNDSSAITNGLLDAPINYASVLRPKASLTKRSSCLTIIKNKAKDRSHLTTSLYEPNINYSDGLLDKSEQCCMFRPASMPGIALSSRSRKRCHCIACCNCSPNERLSGVCSAFIFSKSALMSSVDTGLNNIENQIDNIDCPYSPLTTYEPSGTKDAEELTKLSPRSIVSSERVRYSSLPLYYSTTWCKLCGKAVSPTVLKNIPEKLSDNCDELNVWCYKSRKVKCCCNQNVESSDVTSQNCAENSAGNSKEKWNSGGAQSNAWQTGLDPQIFRKKRMQIKEWFKQFSHEQRCLLLKDLLADCAVPEIHTLSVLMSPRMHEGCRSNCEDWLSFLPPTISLHILSFLDPVSLCRASCVSRGWYEMSNEPSLWRRLCSVNRWRLSRISEQQQLKHWVTPSGHTHWKGVFSERYRLINNWLKGRCNVRTFEGHTQGISCVQFDDTRIVSGSSDKTIKTCTRHWTRMKFKFLIFDYDIVAQQTISRIWDLWNRRTNSQWAVQSLVGHSDTVRCLHLEGNRLVSGSNDCSIKVWDVSSQQDWASIACKVTMIGHGGAVRCLKVDDEKVISGSYDRTLKVWSIKSGACLLTLIGHEEAVLCVQFDSNKIVSGSCDKTIKVWTMEGRCIMTLRGHHDAVTCLQFDDTRIISGSLDCTLRFWDVRTGNTIKTIDWKASEGHTGVIRCLQADRWRVVSASDDRTIKVWSLETGQRLVTLRNHTDGVTCLQFNDNVIVSGSYDKTVKLWDFSSC